MRFMLLTLLFQSCWVKAEQVKVALLFFDGVQIIDFAAPFEVFGQAGYEVFTVSEDGNSVTSAMNLSVNPEYSFSSLPEVDVLVVPGGNVHNVMRDNDTLSWLKKRNRTAKHTLSVCTGSHILAEAGLLDGLTSTTFHRALDSFERDYPETEVIRDKRFADNGKVITSAGLSSGMDAALHIVSKISGLDRAKTIAMHIEYEWQQEQGFVRAQMADRFIPANDYNWPADISLQRLYNYGNEVEWQRAYKASTIAKPSELTAIVKNAMQAHEDKWILKQAKSNFLRWSSDHSKHYMQLVFELTPAAETDSYILRLSLNRE